MSPGPVVGTVLDTIVPILRINLDAEKDAEVRNKFFTLLSRLILDADHTVNSDQRSERDHGDVRITLLSNVGHFV